MMDVCQGDSTLVIYLHHTLTILVDTGGTFYESGIAKNTIIPTLHAHGITSLDYLVLSWGFRPFRRSFPIFKKFFC